MSGETTEVKTFDLHDTLSTVTAARQHVLEALVKFTHPTGDREHGIEHVSNAADALYVAIR